MLLWTDRRGSKSLLLVCFFGSKLKHVQVTAMNIMLPFVQKWKLSIAAAAKIDSRHLIQCCTLPKKNNNNKKKTRHIHSDNWCYLKTCVVLFFKLVISLLQTKCSYTILYCTVGCRLASKLSCHLVRSCVSIFGCCCFREYTGQIGLTFWEANFKARTLIWI